ncbi:uncharacterized protein ASPGLDRAFT_53636, partial [Aspergillus glaucus CBS 516.65]
MDLIYIGLFALPLFVAIRRRINPLWCLERFLHRWGFQNLVKPIRAINKSFTSEKTKQREKEQIRAWRLVVQEYEEILQLELHLLDEKEELEEKMELPGGLTSGQEAALEKVNKGIGGIRPKLWQNGQQFVDLHIEC